MIRPRNIRDAFDTVAEYWSPKVVGRVNDQLMKVAKLSGELVWHAHEHEDELFHVIKGSLRIQLETQEIHLSEGDFVTIPKGVRHNPIADDECWIVLIEPASTKHTGEVVIAETRTLDDQLS